MIAWAEQCEKDYETAAERFNNPLLAYNYRKRIIKDYNLYCHVIDRILEKKGFNLADFDVKFEPIQKTIHLFDLD